MGTVSHAHISGAALLQLEASARSQGSGISAEDLEGCWRLRQVWSKGSSHPAAASSWMLGSLQAQLLISRKAAGLVLGNSVQLGALELRFTGPAELRGKRPLLQFWFERLELRLAQQVIWSRSLGKPEQRRVPFFALIAREPTGWLAARGRGGGLALWERLEAAESN